MTDSETGKELIVNPPPPRGVLCSCAARCILHPAILKIVYCTVLYVRTQLFSFATYVSLNPRTPSCKLFFQIALYFLELEIESYYTLSEPASRIEPGRARKYRYYIPVLL